MHSGLFDNWNIAQISPKLVQAVEYVIFAPSSKSLSSISFFLFSFLLLALLLLVFLSSQVGRAHLTVGLRGGFGRRRHCEMFQSGPVKVLCKFSDSLSKYGQTLMTLIACTFLMETKYLMLKSLFFFSYIAQNTRVVVFLSVCFEEADFFLSSPCVFFFNHGCHYSLTHIKLNFNLNTDSS